jgi:arginase family enzyme
MKDWRAMPLSFNTPVYVSIDLDGLDPAFAPGVSHPEPGGLSTRQVINLIHAVSAEIIGADIVELNPSIDVNGLTAVVAAKLLKEIAAQMLGN